MASFNSASNRIATQGAGTSRGTQPRTFRGRDGALHVPIARHAARRDPPLHPPSTPTRRDPTSGTAREENPAHAATAGGGGVRAGGGGELQRRRGGRRHCCACSVVESLRDACDAMMSDD
jgi:hypothetical protein